MARARTIKPGFFKNEDLADLGFPAMVLFAGLWTLADREGRLEDRPKRIKAEIFPYSSVPIEKLLQDLHEAVFIIRYARDGVRYIAIPTWNQHQYPNKREPASIIPPPCTHNSDTVQEQYRNDAGTEDAQSTRAPEVSGLVGSKVRGNTDGPESRKACLESEDGFDALREACGEAGIVGSDVDWADTRLEWNHLDFEQRLAAVKGLRDRIGAGARDDPAMKALPQNYLRRRMWQRKIVDFARGPDRHAANSQRASDTFDALMAERISNGQQVHETRLIGGKRTTEDVEVLPDRR